MSKHDEFLAKIEAFLKRHNMAKTVFGAKAAGRMGLVKRLREGGGVLMPTEDRVRAFMRDYDQQQRGKKKGTSRKAA